MNEERSATDWPDLPPAVVCEQCGVERSPLTDACHPDCSRAFLARCDRYNALDGRVATMVMCVVAALLALVLYAVTARELQKETAPTVGVTTYRREPLTGRRVLPDSEQTHYLRATR